MAILRTLSLGIKAERPIGATLDAGGRTLAVLSNAVNGPIVLDWPDFNFPAVNPRRLCFANWAVAFFILAESV
jgi:hypothetical protein